MPIVAADATPLLGRPTGIGVAVRGLLESLVALRDPDLEIIGYGLTGRGWRQLPGLVPGGRTVRAPMPAAILQRMWGRFDQPALEWWTGKVDLVHGTNFVVPPTRRAARLVTVHDLTAIRFPELCTPAALRYPALVRRAIAQGADVHTPAQSVAAEICEHFAVDPQRVHVVGWGVDLPNRPVVVAGAEPYILGLGTVEPRKDFPLLVAAFDRIADSHPELRLRIVGPPGWGDAALAAAIDASPHGGRIRRDGWVDDIAAVLAGAAVLAYASVYEGFGLPPLEAMAYGVPVVATAAGAIPEVVGDAADLVPVGDADALAAALARTVDDDAHRRQLIAAGLTRVTSFSWQRSARAMCDLYRQLADSHSRG